MKRVDLLDCGDVFILGNWERVDTVGYEYTFKTDAILVSGEDYRRGTLIVQFDIPRHGWTQEQEILLKIGMIEELPWEEWFFED